MFEVNFGMITEIINCLNVNFSISESLKRLNQYFRDSTFITTMNQKFTAIFIFVGLGYFSLAQQNTVASGGSASGAGGSVSYSVGQIDYTAISASSGNVNQGVQQPYEIYLVSGIQENFSPVTAVFPNPTNGLLTIQLKEVNQPLTIQLLDLTGRVIISSSLISMETSIDLSNYASGEYLLNVTSGDAILNTLKIIKH